MGMNALMLDDERLAALARWQSDNPDAGFDGNVLCDAAAWASVERIDGSFAFGEPFRDLAEFLADIPF